MANKPLWREIRRALLIVAQAIEDHVLKAQPGE
jgi:hypothetical protein